MLRSALTLLVLLAANEARALPRFAARAGTPCIQCHVNPSGGGPRNEYGRNVFARSWLALSTEQASEPWPPSLDMPAGPVDAGSEPSVADPLISFSGSITDWLAVGGDFRLAYIWSRTDVGATPGAAPEETNTFFVMQASLYVLASIHENVRLTLQLTPYSGWEAWGLLDARPNAEDWNVMVKLGRFMPTFGIREAAHDLFTRQWIGLGAADRDTGIEATIHTGPLVTNVAVMNGTLGGGLLDSAGSEHRRFDLAIVARTELHVDVDDFRARAGLSFYWSQNNAEPSPLFLTVLPPSVSSAASEGSDELRVGGFVAANLGRITYLADLVFVRNELYAEGLSPVMGYASYQELSFLVLQGLDVIATFEFMDHDVELLQTSGTRVGLAIEIFPWPYVEIRIMGRRTWNETMPTGGTWEALAFAHLFL